MSYKLNQKDPERRARILARRTKEPVQAKPSNKPRYGQGPMKISNRNACLRRLHKRVLSGGISPDAAKNMIPYILKGTITRKEVYGFKPT